MVRISSPWDSFFHTPGNTAWAEESKIRGNILCVAGMGGCRGKGRTNLHPSLDLAGFLQSFDEETLH